MLSIHDLPPSLLELCWAPLTLCERHRTVPLVCRSWRQQLNSSPQLLHTITLAFKGQRSPTSFRSFFEWMLRWGGPHVRQLELVVELAEDIDPPTDEIAEMLAALLCACGVAGALHELRVEHNLTIPNTAWLAAVRQLRSLRINATNPGVHNNLYLDFDPPSWSLAGLRELRLRARGVTIPPSAHLPTSLTRLCLENFEGPLPAQMMALAQLRELAVTWPGMDAEDYWPLAALHSLRRLVLDGCRQLPACLAQLTQLEAFADAEDSDQSWDEDNYPARGPALQAALPALEGRLTCLALSGTIVGPFAPPSLLTACSGLQALFVMADAGSCIAALPPGPALPSLRYLTGPLKLVASSLDVLQAATQLQFVGAMCFPDEFASFSKLLDWASKHPTLRRLALCGRRDELDSYTAQVSIAFAQRQNPTLCITRHPQPYLRADPEQFLAECGFDAFYNHPGF